MTSKWILPPEEWAFFAKNKSDLISEIQNCWVPKKELAAIEIFELSRSNFDRGGDQHGGFDLPKEQFEILIKKPYLTLTDEEKSRIENCLPKARGWYGKTHIQYITAKNAPVWPPYDMDAYMSLFINWNASDLELKEAFAEILKDKRPFFMEEKRRQGRRTTTRERLKWLSAYRLLRTKIPPVRILEQVDRAFSGGMGKKFYSSPETLKEAASKAEKYVVSLYRTSEWYAAGVEKRTLDPQ